MGKMKQSIKDAAKAVYDAVADLPAQEAAQMQPFVDGVADAVKGAVKRATRPTQQEKQQATKGFIELGEKDGVTVSADAENGRYVVEVPNKYEMTYQLKGMERIGFVGNPNGILTKQNAVYAIDADQMSEGKQRDFMNNVKEARRISAAMMTEKVEIESAVMFNLVGEKPVFYGIPLAAKKNEQGEVMRDEKSNKPLKTPGFVKGEVLNVGEYFVAIRALATDPETKADVKTNKIHMIETDRFLVGDDYKKDSRRDAVVSKMKIDPAKIKFGDGQTFGKVEAGINKYMAFDEKGKVKEINHAYNKAAVQAKREQAKVTNKVELAM